MEYDITEKIRELKRLQKEIDEAEKERSEITQNSWHTENIDIGRDFYLIELIESNQSKIKQIIEEL
jgi:hypothetical protein